MPVPTSGSTPPSTVIVFGGTFDPPHIGHVDLPVLVRTELEKRASNEASSSKPSAWLVYVPAARSPHKQGGPIASDVDRVNMLHLAIKNVPRAAVWTDEIDRARLESESASGGAASGGASSGAGGAKGPSFTVHTLRRARQWLDDAGLSGTQLRLLIGADQAVNFAKWRDPRDILRLAQPAVMVRGQTSDSDLLVRRLREQDFWNDSELAQWSSWVVNTGPIQVSATQVRDALNSSDEGLIAGLVPKPVASYIRTHGLYRARL